MALGNCRVVLVRPQVAGNLGAVARVMRNFGLSDLVLVAPEAAVDAPEALKLSTQGEAILRAARIVASFEEALADCVLTAATSARLGGLFRRQTLGTPDEIARPVVEASRSGPVALVFGPEPTGLSNAEITRCHHLIHIPTSADYPALNLAQAVAICLYELHRAARALDTPTRTTPAVAPFADQERMFAQLRTALEEIHFLYGPKADSLMHGIRHLLGRAQPTPMEVNLLLGLARQLRWYVAHRGQGTARAES